MKARWKKWALLFFSFMLAGCARMVLVVGGMDDNGNIKNSAELYDPASGLFFSPHSTMSTGRMTATATTLPDDTVLVAGGQGPTSGNSAELYQAMNGTFLMTNGMMNHDRIAHTATLLDAAIVSGPLASHVLLAGGDAFSTAGTAEVYQPLSKTFFSTGNMMSPRRQHTAVLISHCGCSADGKVLVVGGYDNQFKVLSSAELYDPATQTFTPTGNLHTPRFRHSATLLNDGTVLIAGGASQMEAKPGNRNPSLNTAEIYDPKTGKFTFTQGTMNAYREAHGASMLGDGTVLLTGGQDEHFLIENTAERYDPRTKTFTALSVSCAGAPPPTGCMRVGRDFHISQTLDDGSVLLAGGVDSTFRTVASAEIYDPASKTFKLTGSMSTPRNGAAASLVISGKLVRQMKKSIKRIR